MRLRFFMRIFLISLGISSAAFSQPQGDRVANAYIGIYGRSMGAANSLLAASQGHIFLIFEFEGTPLSQSESFHFYYADLENPDEAVGLGQYLVSRSRNGGKRYATLMEREPFWVSFANVQFNTAANLFLFRILLDEEQKNKLFEIAQAEQKRRNERLEDDFDLKNNNCVHMTLGLLGHVLNEKRRQKMMPSSFWDIETLFSGYDHKTDYWKFVPAALIYDLSTRQKDLFERFDSSLFLGAQQRQADNMDGFRKSFDRFIALLGSSGAGSKFLSKEQRLFLLKAAVHSKTAWASLQIIDQQLFEPSFVQLQNSDAVSAAMLVDFYYDLFPRLHEFVELSEDEGERAIMVAWLTARYQFFEDFLSKAQEQAHDKN